MLDIELKGQTLVVLNQIRKKEICNFRDYFFSKLKDDGYFLACLGFKINGQGSNNPLFVPDNCITPAYQMLYKLSNMYFSFEDKDLWEYALGNTISVKINTNNNFLNMSDLKEQFLENKIILKHNVQDVEFIKTINQGIELEFIMCLVHSGFDIAQYRWEHNLVDYYLTLSTKHITYQTRFYESKYEIEFSPHIENFQKIYEESCSEYEEIAKF